MKLSVVGALTVAIIVLVNDFFFFFCYVVLSDLSTGDMFAVRQRAKDGEF